MKHLVLGSEGQIGKYVVRELLSREGNSVYEVDLVHGAEHYNDLRIWSREVSDLIKNADYVHFLAFDVGGSTYLQKYQDTYEFVDNNIKIMNNVFGLLKEMDKPFYFASSQMSNMYDSTYGRLKAVGESYTKALGGIVVKFWNVYGHESDPEKTHVITDFIKMAMEDRRILIRTTGTEERSFLYAKDAAKMLVDMVNRHDAVKLSLADPTFDGPMDSVHVAAPNWTSILKVAQIIAKIFDVPIYVGLQEDKNQTITNRVVSRGLRAVYPDDDALPGNYFWNRFTPLETGIAEIVKAMSK